MRVGRATWRSPFAGLCLAVALAASYVVIGLVAVDPTSLFSVDAAVKLLQAQALRDSGFTSVAVPYLAQDFDPEFRFLPFEPPFVFQHQGAIHGVYPSAVAVLNALALSAGLPGLVLLSAGSALIVLLAAGYGAREHAVPVVLMLGAGTPFWAYGVLPWEHLPALACSALAGLLLCHRSVTVYVAAGVALGVAIALRGEFALLLPGLAIVHLRDGGWRRTVGIVLGVAFTLAAAAALDQWVYQRPLFSHVAHAVEVIWSWWGTGSAVERPVHMPLLDRIDIIVGFWIFGLPNGPMLAAVAGLVAVVLAWASRPLRESIVLAILAGAAVLLVRDVFVFAVQPDFVAGLLRVSPVLLFALLPLGAAAPGTASRRAEQWLLLIFVCGLLVSSRHAGAQIGPRFMLPIFPLAVKLAWEGLYSYRQGRRRDGGTEVPPSECARRDPGQQVIWAIGLVLLTGSVAMQALVAVPAYVRLNADERPIAESLGGAAPPVVVISDPFLINHVGMVYGASKVVLARNQTEADEISRRLVDHQVERVGLVQKRGPQLWLPGFVPVNTVHTPRNSLHSLQRQRP